MPSVLRKSPPVPRGTTASDALALIALGDSPGFTWWKKPFTTSLMVPSPPTAMAVRRMMHILEEKGYLRRRQSGREVVYFPRQAKGKAGRDAFEQVLETFFGGSLEEALAAHLHSRKDQVSAAERERLIKLIQQAQREGR